MGGALCWCVGRAGPDRVLEVACGPGRCGQTRTQARSESWGGAWNGGSGRLIKLDPREGYIGCGWWRYGINMVSGTSKDGKIL